MNWAKGERVVGALGLADDRERDQDKQMPDSGEPEVECVADELNSDSKTVLCETT